MRLSFHLHNFLWKFSSFFTNILDIGNEIKKTTTGKLYHSIECVCFSVFNLNLLQKKRYSTPVTVARLHKNSALDCPVLFCFNYLSLSLKVLCRYAAHFFFIKAGMIVPNGPIFYPHSIFNSFCIISIKLRVAHVFDIVLISSTTTTRWSLWYDARVKSVTCTILMTILARRDACQSY